MAFKHNLLIFNCPFGIILATNCCANLFHINATGLIPKSRDMSEQVKEEVQERVMSPFLGENPPPIIKDPYSVPLSEINVIDGRLFQNDLHWDHFKRLREEDPVHFNELPGIGRY
ncbi:MAG: hypothetical protein ACI9CE_003433, partial [Flavobacterium sp.]